MKRLTAPILMTLSILLGSGGCQTTSITHSSGLTGGNLPSCPATYTPSSWSNCYGTISFSDGDKYVGEFRDGKKNGQGTYFYNADNQFKGDKYVGEFRDNNSNGQGIYTKAVRVQTTSLAKGLSGFAPRSGLYNEVIKS